MIFLGACVMTARKHDCGTDQVIIAYLEDYSKAKFIAWTFVHHKATMENFDGD